VLNILFITKINTLKNSKKIEIYIDEEYMFFLYYSYIKKLKLEEGQEIEEYDINDIINNIIIKRGIKRVYHLLSKKDYTTYELTRKLTNSGYKETYTDDIIKYFVDNKWVDDKKYATNYIELMKTRKSKKEIKYKLFEKGVSKDIIAISLDEQFLDEENVALDLLVKKYRNIKNIDYSIRRKMYNYLLRKGFESSNIVNAINKYIVDI
jgi:regulatory protein